MTLNKVPLIVPEPLSDIPETAVLLSRDQLKVVPLTFPVNDIGEIAVAEQTVWEEILAIALGVGFTVMVKSFGVEGHKLVWVMKLPRANGALPTCVVPSIAFVDVFITDTLFVKLLAVYILLPSRLIEIP